MDYNKLKVTELKAELTKRGLSNIGLKAALVERLNSSEEATSAVEEVVEVAVEPSSEEKVDKVENNELKRPAEDTLESESKILKIDSALEVTDIQPEILPSKEMEIAPAAETIAIVEEPELNLIIPSIAPPVVLEEAITSIEPAVVTDSSTESLSFTEPLPPLVETKLESKSIIPLSKPSAPPSESIHISNLVRPFTAAQLKELLNGFGDVSYFWLDSIKTHSFITYSKIQYAQEASEGLQSLVWPATGQGKPLEISFVPTELISSLVEQEEKSTSRLSLTITPPTDDDEKWSYTLTPLAALPNLGIKGLSSSAPAFVPSLPLNVPTGPRLKTTSSEPRPDPKITNRPNYNEKFNLTVASPRIYYCERGGKINQS